jgi:hypothetical protein
MVVLHECLISIQDPIPKSAVGFYFSWVKHNPGTQEIPFLRPGDLIQVKDLDALVSLVNDHQPVPIRHNVQSIGRIK